MNKWGWIGGGIGFAAAPLIMGTAIGRAAENNSGGQMAALFFVSAGVGAALGVLGASQTCHAK